MSGPSGPPRDCPTRIDGRVTLFTHKVTVDQCQSRQRGQYHKCYSCALNNAYVAKNGLPEGVEAEAGREAPHESRAATDDGRSQAARPKPLALAESHARR